jgi:uncharacterized membrane-anchored protein YhcB (DUF1043 family)
MVFPPVTLVLRDAELSDCDKSVIGGDKSQDAGEELDPYRMDCTHFELLRTLVKTVIQALNASEAIIAEGAETEFAQDSIRLTIYPHQLSGSQSRPFLRAVVEHFARTIKACFMTVTCTDYQDLLDHLLQANASAGCHKDDVGPCPSRGGIDSDCGLKLLRFHESILLATDTTDPSETY